jgi:hypothetical protein
MAQMTLEVSKVLEKALTLSTRDRGLLIDQLIASLDDRPAEEGSQRHGPRRASGGSVTCDLAN